MARARGANAALAAVFESTYGTVPGSGFRKMPFVSINLGEEQGLIESDLLGFGREPLDPAYDVISNEGDLVVPMDVRNIGVWLRGLLGAPTTAAAVAATGKITFSAQPAANSTITLGGVAWTFVASGATGNQTNIGVNLAATLTSLASNLNASANTTIDDVTYAATATELTMTHDTLGHAGNAFTLAASTSPASNGTVSGATLTGGANDHTFTAGGQTLPSMSLEIQLADVPFFGMNYGARVNSFQVQAQRSGLLTATLNLIAQGESIAATTQAGSLVEYTLERFGQFQGEVRRNGSALGNVVNADMTFSNNLEAIEVIRSDGRIADADPGVLSVSGNINTRFQDRVLLDQATARDPCEIVYAWAINASKSITWTLHRVFLPRNDRQIQGPQGIQVPFNFQASRDPGLAKTATCVLRNDVASY
jgi:hypothetical protein